MNPYILETILKEKREDMLREAERQRLIAQYEAGQPQIRSRIATAIGNILIRLGEGLKKRYGLSVNVSTTS